MAEESIRRADSSGWASGQASQEVWDKLQKELAEALKARERVEGIVYMCSLDLHLELLLKAVMIDDKSVVKELMKDDRLLGSFSSKLKLAYALGLIPEPVRKDLEYLNKIRNAFAHQTDVESFDMAPICDYCRELSTVESKHGSARSSAAACRVAYIDNALFLTSEIEWQMKKNTSLQRQLADSVESRYAAFRERWNKLAE